MATATTLAQVKNIPEAVERALYAAHASLHGTPTVPHNYKNPAGDIVDAEDVWIIPSFNLGPATGHLFKRPDNFLDFDIFDGCVIEWEMSTPRVPDATPALIAATYSLFASEATRIRLCMDPALLVTINAALDYHHLTRLYPLGENMGFDNSTGEDKATLRWKCMLGIKNDAWPVAGSVYTSPFGLT